MGVQDERTNIISMVVGGGKVGRTKRYINSL